MTVAGDAMEIDFEGTCAQVGRNINSPIASTQSAVMSCIKGVLIGGDVPFNEGSFRPVTIKVPYGSILNPKPPAPVRARMLPCYRAYDAVMKALAQVAPERAIASGFDNALITCLARLNDGRYRVCLETYGGGFGAAAESDGADGIAAPLSNTTNSPVEALDMEFDYFRIVGYTLNPDSFGHGRNRGGLGMRRTYEMLKDDVDFSLYGDRFEIVPEGLASGTAGALTRAEVIPRRQAHRHRPQARHAATQGRSRDRVHFRRRRLWRSAAALARARAAGHRAGRRFRRDGKKRIRLRGVAGRRLTVSRRGCGWKTEARLMATQNISYAAAIALSWPRSILPVGEAGSASMMRISLGRL